MRLYHHFDKQTGVHTYFGSVSLVLRSVEIGCAKDKVKRYPFGISPVFENDRCVIRFANYVPVTRPTRSKKKK